MFLSVCVIHLFTTPTHGYFKTNVLSATRYQIIGDHRVVTDYLYLALGIYIKFKKIIGVISVHFSLVIPIQVMI